MTATNTRRMNSTTLTKMATMRDALEDNCCLVTAPILVLFTAEKATRVGVGRGQESIEQRQNNV